MKKVFLAALPLAALSGATATEQEVVLETVAKATNARLNDVCLEGPKFDEDSFGSVRAEVFFAKEGVESGSASVKSHGSKKQGYSTPEDTLERRTVDIHPIPRDALLERDNIEVLNLRKALSRVGVTEDTVDLGSQTQRLAIGAVLLNELGRHFGRRPVHLADTSRVSGGAAYGEATVRDTSSTNLRAGHHVVHLDKYWPGVEELYGESSQLAAIHQTILDYTNLWGEDWERLGVEPEKAAAAMLGQVDASGQRGYYVNVWTALTKGGIKQQPLAVGLVSEQLGLHEVATQHVQFNTFNDTITLLKANVLSEENGTSFAASNQTTSTTDAAAAEGDAFEGRRGDKVTFHWRPNMAFGETLVLLTTKVPHTAVWIEGAPSVPRRSAEMRMLLLPEEVENNKCSM